MQVAMQAVSANQLTTTQREVMIEYTIKASNAKKSGHVQSYTSSFALVDARCHSCYQASKLDSPLPFHFFHLLYPRYSGCAKRFYKTVAVPLMAGDCAPEFAPELPPEPLPFFLRVSGNA